MLLRTSLVFLKIPACLYISTMHWARFLFLYYIKQIDSMLPCVCSVIDHRGLQNVVRTSVTHSAAPHVPLFLFLPHFDVICDLLLNRRTATWNLFVNYNTLWGTLPDCFMAQFTIRVLMCFQLTRNVLFN